MSILPRRGRDPAPVLQLEANRNDARPERHGAAGL
jgi:hypothetical protein